MELSVDAGILSHGLSSVAKAISHRPTHPVLGCVLVNATEQGVKLTGFDLSLGIEVTIPAEVLTPGAIAIPAKLFGDIVTKVDGVLRLRVKSGEYGSETAEIKYQSGAIEISCFNAADFPQLPVVNCDSIAIPSEALQEGIKYTAFAASTDETKQILTGIHLKGQGEVLELAATDGHRLAKIIVPLEGGALDFKVTLPSRALRGLEKILNEETVIFAADKSQAVFQSSTTRLTCRVLDGDYPAYNQLLPTEFNRRVIIDRKRLLTAIDRVGVFAGEKNNLLQMDFREHDVLLLVESQDVGCGKDLVPADISGKPLTVSFNLGYLRAGLAAIAAPEIVLNLNFHNAPAVLTPIDSVDYSYLVMPVTVPPP
jgi:DNA polymerase-3 subunit beta